MKKLVSLFLALMLVFSLAAGAAATEVEEENTATELGSITISGASDQNIYTIYKMLDLESYQGTAYSYKVNAAWENFFKTEEAKAYMSVDTAGYVTWVGADSEQRVIAFSKLALDYAQKNDIAYVASSKDMGGAFIQTDGEGNVYGKFSDLELGYYLVDSTMGSLCGLTTTDRDAVINAKNAAPTIDKQVQEDSTQTWSASNTAGISETVNYRVSINITGGAQNFVLHDTMSQGLTFQPDSVKVYINNATDPIDNTDNLNFTVVENPGDVSPMPDGFTGEARTDNCTFHVKFADNFYTLVQKGDTVWVHYSATLNENAKIGNESDPNRAILGFGEGHFSNEDSVDTYTYGIDIVKTDETSKIMLKGAEFLIYDAETGGNLIKVVEETGADGKIFYRLAMPEDLQAPGKENGDVIVIPEGGVVRVVGFDVNNAQEYYWLHEEKAPEGYNQLTARQKFQITATNGNLYANHIDGAYVEGTGVHVKNKTGAVLPTTGAMGTTMFLTFGTLVVLATGVLLVTKKRMTMIED